MLPAGQPHGQVVLVIRRDPGGAQYGPDIQTEGEENAHQSDQLQRRQRGHPDLLCAAHRRRHARSKLCQTIKLKTMRRVSLWRQNCCSRPTHGLRWMFHLPSPARMESCVSVRVPSALDVRCAAGAGPRISEVADTCPCWVLVPGARG